MKINNCPENIIAMRITVSDETGSISCSIWGNMFYREKQFRVGDKMLFWGKVNYNYFEKALQFEYRDHRKFEPGDDTL